MYHHLLRNRLWNWAVAFVFCHALVAGESDLDKTARLTEQREEVTIISGDLNELERAAPEVAIPRLNWIVRATGDNSFYQIEERWDVHFRARKLLMSIPGHARHHERLIRELRENLLAEREGKPIPHVKHARSDYDSQRLSAFRTLAQLPSPEAVEVLGGFLRDFEWIGYTGNPRYAKRPGAIPPNGVLAARALGELIEKPPVQKEPRLYSFDDAEIWQLWFEQVKAGSRTFRFKGNPQEFTLAGPADSAKSPLTDRPSKREAAPSLIAANNTPVSLWKVAVIPASLILCGIALWRSLRKRTRAKD